MQTGVGCRYHTLDSPSLDNVDEKWGDGTKTSLRIMAAFHARTGTQGLFNPKKSCQMNSCISDIAQWVPEPRA